MTQTPAQPQARGVRIDAQPGHAAITLDGNALPPGTVTGYVLEHSIADSLPLLILHTRQPDGSVFEGLARVAVGVPKTPGDLIAAFLAEVDPVLLDQEALNRSDYGGGPGATARAMLAVLTEWVRGGKGGS
ncbi:hypothetical protein [Streptomyces caniscabiei]|uniref:Uncharacterized protein n=1 Tax=Streptomyces caniscabiei TaxID=2746961 RepID=A0ABU4N0L7_9ACTN|nr:hypothetical protein [Streptomyces caniscabiei]MBE4790354.1 hypothetical protein [Streptomyces caniscabiei]MBE4799543.1 hypothetical protein [Streptomyces caniscabiei]MDX3015212.1 hypothetical protein [Streptomyces caniscabiei]MDX3042527.1 hypothetical protein [Streptomyces caniscabiei]